jgi:hypothetical protein
VTGYEWKIDDTIMIIKTLDVSVANTAVRDGNPDVVFPQFWRLICEWLERLTHHFGSIS